VGELNVMFPSIPSWDAVHPLIVHFPIALLLGAPVLVIIGLLLRRQSVGLFIAAFVLMVIGTTATYVAVASGEATAEVSARLPTAATVLENHEELAETTRVIFTVLTVIFAAILFGPRLVKRRLGHRSAVVLTVAFLLLYSAGSLVLINAAHQGGRLVHEFGLRAGGTNNATPTVSETSKETRKEKRPDKDND
jgi:uncharacterized membrane protein